MRTLYDTGTVRPHERYDYYRAGAGAELAPVAIRGNAPDFLHVSMSVAQIGDFGLETVTGAADGEVAAVRTERLIRVSDPECYRVMLSVSGGAKIEQEGNRVHFGARDIALYDLSRTWDAVHPMGRRPVRAILLTFPHASLPIGRATVRPMLGTAMPRSMPGRSLIAEWLIELAHALAAGQECAPDLAGVLRECTVGLIRQRLGHPHGITPHTRRLLYMTRVRTFMRRDLADPDLNPDRMAKALNISPRYLHQIFQDSEFTPMQLLKRLRLEACHRALQDPTLAATPIKAVAAAHGYVRNDQFARDFKQLFGVSAKHFRQASE